MGICSWNIDWVRCDSVCDCFDTFGSTATETKILKF